METKKEKTQKNIFSEKEKGLKTLNSFEKEFDRIDVKLAYFSLFIGVLATALAFIVIILMIEIVK